MAPTSFALDTNRLSQLVGLGYEAPLGLGNEHLSGEKEAWRAFTHEAAAAFGCQLAMVEYFDAENSQRSFIAAGGLNGFEEVFSTARSRKAEDIYLNGMRHKPTGTVLLGTEILTPEQMRQTRSYSMLAMPWHLEHFLMGAVLTRDGATAFFALGRTSREAPFVTEDKAVISGQLISHLTRSMTLRQEAAAMHGANALLATVLQQAPTGLVVIDWQGKPVMVNERARAIFAAKDGLSLVNGQLRATDAVVQAQLDQALASMLHVARGQLAPAPAAVMVTRRLAPRPYRVQLSLLSPLGNRSDFPRGSAVVAVIHEERRAGSQNVPSVLRATYGLTRAEVRLCQGLLDGQSLQEVAHSLGVSRNTAKTHLARIFDKTGVRTQMALLRLLAVGARG